jgi:hypothetical protein
MAATKWLDPGVDWDDVALGCPIHEAWQAIKEASDERNAYYNATDDTGFTGSETWPDLADAALWFDNGAANLANYMTSALQYPENGMGTIDASSITTSGAAWFPNPPFYDILTLQQVMEDFGWPAVSAQRLLHMNTTSDGANTAPITKEWLKQWYQALSFNVYNRSAIGSTIPYTDDVEKFYIKIEITYTWTGGVFASAVADVTNPEFDTPVDIYVGGDLPEVTQATYQDVLDYGQTIFEDYFSDDDKWATESLVGTSVISSKAGSEADLTGDGTLVLDITYRAFRFKKLQGYRPTTGQRFDQEVWWNGYFGVSGDQNTGEANREILLRELAEDSSSWIYTAVLKSQGAAPFTAPDYNDNYNNSAVLRSTLNDDNVAQQTILLKPNLTDGTGFEYYTPAP